MSNPTEPYESKSGALLEDHPELAFYKDVVDNLYDAVYFVDRQKKIIYWNKGAERLTGYAAEQVLGSSCSENVLVHVDQEVKSLCDLNCPLSQTIRDGSSHDAELFVRHKDGHRVLVAVSTKPIKNADGQIVGAVEIFKEHPAQVAIRQKMIQLQELALLDPLTRLANRRYTETSLQRQFDELSRYIHPFGILFIDVDNFKEINDTYGHPGGDQVLRLLSRTVQNSLRPFDFLGRWGGDEFVAIVVKVSEEQLRAIAERARLLVEQTSVKVRGEEVAVTVSIGAALAREGDTIEDLIGRADGLMYCSKSSGKNRVSAHPHATDPGVVA